MIELDTSAFVTGILDQCQAKWIGNRNGLIWFTDSLTKSTHVIDPKDFTLEKVRAKLAASRLRFRVSMEKRHDQPRRTA